jgi:hypothetical chaperone protein
MLERISRSACSPERIAAFIHLVKEGLGYQLHDAVRRTKFELSASSNSTFDFNCGPLRVTQHVTRSEFEKWIHPELQSIAACVDGLLKTTGVPASAIDHVFLTGGSSFVPAVRAIFIERFGPAKITGGEELTSVATGLAVRASEQWERARYDRRR